MAVDLFLMLRVHVCVFAYLCTVRCFMLGGIITYLKNVHFGSRTSSAVNDEHQYIII